MAQYVVNLRGWAGLEGWRQPTQPTTKTSRLGQRVSIVLLAASDASATDDRLGLGAFLVVRGRSVLDAGIIVADDPAAGDPAAVADIEAWAHTHPAQTTVGPRPWRVVTVSAFCVPFATVDNAPWAFQPRAYSGAGFVVGADLGRTFGLLAEHCGARRGANADGWEVWLPGWGRRTDNGWHRVSPNRPELRMKARRSGWAIEFAPCGKDANGRPFGKRLDGRSWRGAFIDVFSLAESVDADRAGSFGEHRQNLGLEAVELPVQVPVDRQGAARVTEAVLAIHQLALALDDEAARWFTTSVERAQGRGRMSLTHTTSPGALAAAIPGRFGIESPLARFALTEDEHRSWAESFHGGWNSADHRLLGQPFPVAALDVSSCFPLVAHRIGWWELLTADHLRRRDVTAALQMVCQRAAENPSTALDPSVWQRLGCTLVEVVSDGEPFPVEVEDPQRPDGRLEVVPVFSPRRPLFFAWPDVVAAAVLSGRVPTIRRATRLVPVGRQRGLRQHLRVLPGLVLHVDEDPVLRLVRERRRATRKGEAARARGLRVVVNSLCYGNLGRFDDLRRNVGRRWVVAERPGPWNFFPIASTITAGARLLLAALERLVVDRGGVVAYRDTDSSLVPASPRGGTLKLADGTAVRVLSWCEAAGVVAAFDRLSPAPWWPVWKTERGSRRVPLQAVVFGPKRHVEFVVHEGRVEVVDRTDANLGGFYADPPSMPGRAPDGNRLWSLAVAEQAVATALARHGDDTIRRQAPWDAGQPDAFPRLRRLSVTTPETLRSLPAVLGARPGTRYVEAAADSLMYANVSPVALDPGGDLTDWRRLGWVDRHDGESIAVRTAGGDHGQVPLVALADTALAWSSPRHRDPVRSVTVDRLLVSHAGRVSSLIDADINGLPGDLLARRPTYEDAERLAVVQTRGRALGKRGLARLTGLPLKVAERAALGQQISRRNVTRALQQLDVEEARCCGLDGCEDLVIRANATYCSPRCRETAKKRRQRAALKGLARVAP
jgi:hypothetical protein